MPQNTDYKLFSSLKNILFQNLKLKNYSKKNNIGFTMIEILVVVTVIGIMAITMIPVIKSYKSNLELNGCAREIISDLRFAQQMTIAEQKEYSVVFYVLEKKYEIAKYGETTEIIKQVFLPDEIIDISITALTNNEIKYNPYGAVFESGIISLENSENKIKTIDVRPSGFVKIND